MSNILPGCLSHSGVKFPKMKTISRKFDSLTALSAFIANTSVCGFFENYPAECLASVSGSEAKTNTESYDTANNLMLGGWHDGAKRVQVAMVQSASASSDRPRCYNSVVGFAPNVPNYLAGYPLNMINKKRVRVPARVVDIVYNCAVDYGVESNKIETAAAKLFNVAVSLERSGVRANLWVMVASEAGRERFVMAVKIKSANQPFNLVKMIYPVVHPSFLRRHGLAVMERAGLSRSTKWGCYGRPISDDKKQKECASALGVNTQNVFNYYQVSEMTEREITNMIK